MVASGDGSRDIGKNAGVDDVPKFLLVMVSSLFITPFGVEI